MLYQETLSLAFLVTQCSISPLLTTKGDVKHLNASLRMHAHILTNRNEFIARLQNGPILSLYAIQISPIDHATPDG